MSQPPIIRQFTPTTAEYEAIVQVYQLANPYESGSASAWQHWDQHRDPERLFTRYVAEQAGEIVGYGFTVRTDPVNNKFRFAAYFPPALKTAAFVDHFSTYLMEKCLAFKPAALIARAREDEPVKTVWLQAQGFEFAMRSPCSMLDVTAFDPLPYQERQAKIKAQGIEILSLAELAGRDPDWQRKAYELDMRLSADVPRPTPFTPSPFVQYAQREFEDPEFMPNLWLIAMAEGQYVGMTSLYKTGDGVEQLETGLTGVRRDYRRRGLALALKCRAATAAQQLGSKRIITFNEENNPMFYLNLQLGFKPLPADIDWKLELEGV